MRALSEEIPALTCVPSYIIEANGVVLEVNSLLLSIPHPVILCSLSITQYWRVFSISYIHTSSLYLWLSTIILKFSPIRREEKMGGVEGGGEAGRGRGRERKRGKKMKFHFNYQEYIIIYSCNYHAGQCNIQYNNMALRYGVMGFLQCPSSVPGPARWWRSTEQCDSFIDYSSPQCRDLSCPVFANSSYFYYCCTAPTVNDVLSARDGERSCFRIQSW